MKVLEIKETNGDGRLELHPRVTVARVGDPIRRAWLISALGSLPRGGDIGATGTVEAHGMRFDVDAGSLALLGLGVELDSVVSGRDLPGHDRDLEAARLALTSIEERAADLTSRLEAARAALTTAIEHRDQARTKVEELQRGDGDAREIRALEGAKRSRVGFELEAASAERIRAEQALSEAVLLRDSLTSEYERLQARSEAAKVRHQAAMDQAIAAAAAREAEQAHGVADENDDPVARRVAAQDRLRDAERKVNQVPPQDSPLSAQIDLLNRRRIELVQRRVALGEGASKSVEDALAKLISPTAGGTPIVAALALADTWRDLHQQIGALDSGVSPAERAAEDSVESARQALQEAEKKINQPVLTPEQIAKVEDAHAAVLDAQDRLDARFGRSRAQKKLEELRSDERRVLERLGFSTYADYMMSSSSRGVGQANRSVAESLRRQLTEAEEALEAIPGAADRARRRTELFQRRDDVSPKVAELLGYEPTGPEAEEQLRSLREGDVDKTLAVRDLGLALTTAGMDVGPEPWDEGDLVLLARSFVAEDESAEREREDSDAAIAALESRIDKLRGALESGERQEQDVSDLPDSALVAPRATQDQGQGDDDGPGNADGAEALWAEVEAARVALSESEAAESRHLERKDRLSEVEAQLVKATQDEADAAAALAAAESESNAGFPERIAEAAVAVDEAELALARARTAEEDLGRQYNDEQAGTGIDALIAESQADLEERVGAMTQAAQAEEALAAELSDLELQRKNAQQKFNDLSLAAVSSDVSELIGEIDWALLARLADLRSVGVAGSVPLVLDDPFDALPDDEVGGVLDRLVRMASTVQIVVVSDRPAIRVWADSLGSEQATTVKL